MQNSNQDRNPQEDDGCFESMREETLETVHFTPACTYRK